MRFRLLLLCLATFVSAQRYGQYHDLIMKASREAKIPASLLAGLLYAESEGVASCTSERRADGYRDEGIAQLNSRYLPYFAWKFNKGKKVDPYSPAQAIPVAARILKFNYAYFGDWVEAIAAYRQGITGILNNGVTHISALYVDKVLQKGYLLE